ncbi:hypothetical protein ABZ957_36790 [Streptomyces sp. NPDC046316]|uniref:hypothetical protein n=1 Tax=unclassified Streptomyces TaxID=2593676 RepID=UPI0033FA41FC
MWVLPIKDALGAADRIEPFPPSSPHTVTQSARALPERHSERHARRGTHLAAVTGNSNAVIDFVTMEDILEEFIGEAA